MPTLLEDIRQLNQRGETRAASDLIDLWLAERPADLEARLLKAEICLSSRENYAYVGQLLLDFANQGADESAEAFESLRQRSAELAWSLVAAGRERLRSRYPDQALDDFDAALALDPLDPVLPLAAGLALVCIQPARDADAPYSPFDDGRRRLSPTSLTAAVEKYLSLVITRTQPDERPYEVAAAALVRQWIGQGRMTHEALALLATVVHPTPATVDLLAQLGDRVRALVLETVANLLRIGLPDQAHRLMTTCARAKFVSARLALYEAERCADQPEIALAAYRRVSRLAKQNTPALRPDTARTLLIAAQGVQVKCPHCGKITRPNASACIFCETPLLQRPLLIDAYPDAPDAALAQIGMADVLARRGETSQALDHWQIAAALLPDEHPARPALDTLRGQLLGTGELPAASSICQILPLLDAHGVSPDLLLQVARINENEPESWRSLPTTQRARVIRRLIDAGQLALAQVTLTAAFADQPERKLAARLRARLDESIDHEFAAVLDEAQRIDQPEAAIARLSQALDLRADARLFLARGQARLASGADLAALDDFYAAMPSENERTAARKMAALVLERRWDLSGARALLDLLDADDPDVVNARERLTRRERGEPFILTERAVESVMEDTLKRRSLPPFSNGYFALAVREVGYTGGEAWLRKLIAANAEFVRVLGALRDVMGDAIFVLRTISHPHRQIPERGSVTLALLVRVSAQDDEQCRARALQLWNDIHAILPLAHENVYVFEPVFDQDELQSLLTPFELTHAAEIVHQEFDGEGVYTVNPFTPGALDLHNLHWALLRQSAPAMISIHLKPTNLLPWERSTSFESAPSEGYGDYALSDGDSSSAELMNRHLARVQLLQIKHVQLSSLHSTYLLRVYVAGGADTSQLLPEMAAAALFAPLHDDGRTGGYDILRVGSPREADVLQRNLSALDVESWVHEDGRLARFRYLVGEAEAAQVFRLPIPGVEGVPGMIMLEGKPVVPPVGMPENGTRLGVSVARVKGVPLPITQSEADRHRHLYVVGKTGMGKSTLLMTLILQDIEAGRGVFLLDPHGDLCDDVLARIPAYRAADVILLDPSDAERPIGLNILDAETEADQHRVVNEFIGLLTRLYDPHNQAIVGPIFQQNVRNAMLAAMSLPDGTLIDVYRLLSDSQYVKRVLPHIQDPLVKNYWEEIAARVSSGASDHWKAELLPYLLSKFSRFVEDGTLRRMIGQPRTSIPWGKVMDEGKILLVNLAKGRIGQENAQFIGSLVLSSVLQAAFRRGELPASRRREFYLYIDEVQNYATPMLATMLSEGRKFGVSLTIANQFLHQLDNGIREAVFGNVGSLIAFRVGAQDAPALAPEFYPVFSPGDLLNLPQFTACAKLLIDGVAARPFSLRTLPPMLAADSNRAASIREQSRQCYGTDIARVQQDILKKF